ncbi:MFS transporter [Xenorhabdus nematophila]|uniref:MFS transporter n=1 Tax=Xenorhabdus nematophila TaxID=628 RepID=UPI000AD068B7|nr:MFS transporter [Xenorhabdus nematophila]
MFFLLAYCQSVAKCFLAYSAKALGANRRVKVIGSLLTSLFAGLLLARVLAGWVGEHIGWRGVYLLVGAITLFIGIGLFKYIDNVAVAKQLSYYQVLKQQRALWNSYPELRRLALVSACFFAISNGIWANLSSLIHATLHWNASQIGLLAFTSLAALRATWATQHLQNRMEWQYVIILLALGMTLTSVVGISIDISILILLVFLTVSDFCIRGVQAIAQSRVLNIDPTSASRLNSLFMTVFFFGAAFRFLARGHCYSSSRLERHVPIYNSLHCSRAIFSMLA